MEIAHLMEMLRREARPDAWLRGRTPCAPYSSSVSSTTVKGPSFTSETLMSAPKLPV